MPAALATSFLFPLGRVTSGYISKRTAERAARRPWLVADHAIGKLGVTSVMEVKYTENERAVRKRLNNWTEVFLPTLMARDFDAADLPADLGLEVLAASLDGLIGCERR